MNGVSASTSTQGECVGVVGESGRARARLFLAAMGLLAGNGKATGSVTIAGKSCSA